MAQAACDAAERADAVNVEAAERGCMSSEQRAAIDEAAAAAEVKAALARFISARNAREATRSAPPAPPPAATRSSPRKRARASS